MTTDLHKIKAQLIAIAANTIASSLKKEKYIPPELPPPFDKTQGVFVTLYSEGRSLRGCIGHIRGLCSTLAEEIVQCAYAAAFQDPRFPPITAEEFSEIELEISLLYPPEDVYSPDELNPNIYGVIVSSGSKKGLLLPGIEGVDTVEEQIEIACNKAGIFQGEKYKLQKFKVDKIG